MVTENVCPRCGLNKPRRYPYSRVCGDCVRAQYDEKNSGAKERRESRKRKQERRDPICPKCGKEKPNYRKTGYCYECFQERKKERYAAYQREYSRQRYQRDSAFRERKMKGTKKAHEKIKGTPEYKRKRSAKRRQRYEKTHKGAAMRREARKEGMCVCRKCGQYAKYDPRHGHMCLDCFRIFNKERIKKRTAMDPGFAAVLRVRTAVRIALKKTGEKKRCKTSEIIGYPLSEIREWVEKQGGLPRGHQIDHIVPISWWLQRYPNDFKRAMRGAWKLSNLRIISASENRRKSGKREFLI